MKNTPTIEDRSGELELRAHYTNRYFSPEHRARIGEAQRGRPKTPETRAKISAALIGRPQVPRSPEVYARIGAAHRGMVHTLQGDRTTCMYGHPFDVVEKSGKRHCRTCANRRKHEYRQRLAG